MARDNQGPLEAILKVEKSDGENLKKMVDATKAILDAIGTNSAAADKGTDK